jgi:hypothetical protein
MKPNYDALLGNAVDKLDRVKKDEKVYKLDDLKGFKTKTRRFTVTKRPWLTPEALSTAITSTLMNNQNCILGFAVGHSTREYASHAFLAIAMQLTPDVRIEWDLGSEMNEYWWSITIPAEESFKL